MTNSRINALTREAVSILEGGQSARTRIDELAANLPDNGVAFRAIWDRVSRGGKWDVSEVTRAVTDYERQTA